MPFQIFKQRIFTPIDKQSIFAQRTNWLEFGLAQFLRWSMESIKPNTAGFVFYSKEVWIWLYRFRRWRCGASYIGDTVFEPFEDVRKKKNVKRKSKIYTDCYRAWLKEFGSDLLNVEKSTMWLFIMFMVEV